MIAVRRQRNHSCPGASPSSPAHPSFPLVVPGELATRGGGLTWGDARDVALARAAHAGVFLHAVALPLTLAGVQIGILVAIGALVLTRLLGRRWVRSGLEAPLLLAAGGMLLAVAVAAALGLPPRLASATRWKPVLAPIVIAAALAFPVPGEDAEAPRRRALAAVLAWCGGAALASTVGIGQAALGIDLLYASGWRAAPRLAPVPQWPGHFAAVGFYPWYPQFAHNLAPPLALAAGLVLGAPVGRRPRAALALGAVLAAAAVTLTVSRGAWLSLVAVLGVLFALSGRWPRRVVAGAAAVLAAVSLLHPGLRVRLEVAHTAGVNVNRLELLRVCEAVRQDHPLGVGPGNFTRAANPYFDALAPGAVRTGCHMTPLGLLVEGGPPLALAWAAAGLLLVRTLLRWRRRGDALARAAAAGGLAALVAFAVNGLFHDVHRESYALWALGFALGIAAVLAGPRAGAARP
jgi:hypothetical protein